MYPKGKWLVSVICLVFLVGIPVYNLVANAQSEGEYQVDLKGYYTKDVFSSKEKPNEATCFPALPAEELPESGKTWMYRGISFKMPEVSGLKKNAVLVDGITIKVPRRVYTEIYLLGIPLGTPNKGEITIVYINGSKEKIEFGVTNWWKSGEEGQFGEKQAVAFTHHNNRGKAHTNGAPHPLWFHSFTLKNPDKKAVKAIVFPDTRKPKSYHAYLLIAMTLICSQEGEATEQETSPMEEEAIAVEEVSPVDEETIARKEISVVKIVGKAPVINGRLDDPAWKKAAELTGFSLLDTGEPALNQTKVLVLCNEVNLYVSFYCHDPQIKKIVAEVREGRDGPLWKDDCVELFLDPLNDGSTYYHFIVNSLGLQYDGRCLAGEKTENGKWDGVWEAKTAKEKDYWTVEMAIPFATLGLAEGKVKNEWGGNFCREFQHHTLITHAASPADLPQELSSLFPATGGFCNPDQFGLLKGLKVNFSSYFYTMDALSLGEGVIGTSILKAEVKNDAGSEDELVLRLNILTPEGKTLSEQKAVTLQKGKSAEVDLNYTLKDKGEHLLQLLLESNRGFLHSAQLYKVEVPSLLDLFLLGSSQTFEDFVKTKVIINTKMEELVDKQLEVLLSNADDESFVSTKIQKLISRKNQVSFDISSIPLGSYVLEAHLVGTGGKLLGSSRVPFEKISPEKANRVTLDENYYLKVNGKSLFPFGFYNIDIKELYADRGDLQSLEKRIKILKDAGVTVVRLHWVHFHKAAFAQATLDFMHKQGLKVIVNEPSNSLDYHTVYGELHETVLNPELPEYENFKVDSLAEGVRRFRDHPALLAWYVSDEAVARAGYHPELEQLKPDNLKRLINIVRQEDPYHPIMITENLSLAAGEWALKPYLEAFENVDICTIDKYWPAWFPKGTPRAALISILADFIDAYRKWFNNEKAMWTIYQFHYSGKLDEPDPNKAMPTPAEMRCQVYLNIVHNGGGILYWQRNEHKLEEIIEKHPEEWKTFSACGNQIKELTPVICSTPLEDKFAFESEDEGYIHATMREFGKKRYLFVVNAKEEPVTAKFTVKGVSYEGPIKILFEEGQPVSFQNNSFSDQFEKYQAKVYEIPCT